MKETEGVTAVNVYDMYFLFAFLPLYMGVFALVRPARRAWVIALGNIVMALSCGVRVLAVFVGCTLVCYIAASAVEKLRDDPGKEGLRRGLTAVIYLLAAAAVAACSPRGLQMSLLMPFKSAMMAVLPLHMISYMADVYRGDCKAQKDPLRLAAYLGFFPSMGYGPALKYKTSKSSFDRPGTDISRLSEGVRFYIMGLAAYVVIAVRLEELHRELLGTPASQLHGYTTLMGVLVYYAWFGTAVISSVFMGHGLAVMQGIRTGHGFKRRFMQPSVYQRLREFNIPLCRWLKDYVTMPLRRAGLHVSEAQAVSILLGALWYSLSTGWLAAAVLLSSAVAIQSTFSKKQKRGDIQHLLGSFTAKLVTLAAVACAALWELINGKAGFGALRTGSADSDFFYTFFGEAIVPVIIGLLISGSMLHSLAKRMNLGWFRLVLPLVEIVFLAIATAYLLR